MIGIAKIRFPRPSTTGTGNDPSMYEIKDESNPTAAGSGNTKDTRTGHALSIPAQSSAVKIPTAPSQNTASYSQTKQTIPPTQQTKKPINPLLEPVRACSHCSLPTTTTVQPIYSEANAGGLTPNKVNGLGLPATNNFQPNSANNYKETSNVDSNTKINSNPNNGVVRPQINNVYSGNSPNLSDGVNLIPNNLQIPLDTNSQSYGPLESSEFNQQNSADNRNKNNYQNILGSSLSRSSQEINLQQLNPNQPSGIENPIGSSFSQPFQGNKSQQYNPTQTSSINNSRQHFSNGPSANSVNTENSSYNQNYPQDLVGNSAPVYSQDNTSERNPKQLNRFGQAQTGGGQSIGGNFGTPYIGKPNKPLLISAQMQIVDKKTDVYYKKPGEKDGLPKGLTKGDMENLLYTFNYTLAFHGHYEEGYTNGAKQGYYFVTGRNGVRTRVDYVADENGFRPKITQEVLDLISEDVPKPETEKDEKYGLGGYEFKWLYFPVGSKQG